MAHSMSKPFSRFSSTPSALANPSIPPTPYNFADPPPPLIREEKLLLGIKITAATIGLMIFIVVLIVKLRESRSNSSSGSNASDGGGSIINNQFSTIQLPALNTDDSSVIASDV